MGNEKEINQKRQEHILKALDFLKNGGDFSKASTFLQKAKDDRPEFANVEGHPLNTLYAENAAITNLIEEKLLPDLKKWQQDGKNEELLDRMRKELKKLQTIKYHYMRKENSLYSFLIKYNLISENGSSALWAQDNRIRANVDEAYDSVEAATLPDKYVIEEKVEKVAKEVLWMVFYEDTILLPLLTVVSSPTDWYIVKQDELEIGYTLIDYPKGWTPSQSDIDRANWQRDQAGILSDKVKKAYAQFLHDFLSVDITMKKSSVLRGDPSYPIGDENSGPDLVLDNVQDVTVKMEIGSLTLKEIPAIFNVLPVDCTFVDKFDKVKWFSNTDRVFPRTRSVIGRPVIRCHPPKSIDKVMKILDDFHKGMADSRDFWINVHGRMIYLCFYAVRDNEDNYLGCLETVQDITKFKTLSGEKTLENQDQYDD